MGRRLVRRSIRRSQRVRRLANLLGGHAVVGLDVGDEGEIGAAEAAHGLEKQVGLILWIGGGAEMLVGAAADAGALHGREVVGEALVDHVDAVGDAREREHDPGRLHLLPVDGALVAGDVDAGQAARDAAVRGFGRGARSPARWRVRRPAPPRARASSTFQG